MPAPSPARQYLDRLMRDLDRDLGSLYEQINAAREDEKDALWAQARKIEDRLMRLEGTLR